MKSVYKYIVLYAVFLVSIFGLFHNINNWYNENIEIQKDILVKQARTHFDEQTNTRKWNSRYGGVYAKPLKGESPNPYLKNNILKVDENLTLIKINPAWMTRQLSELLDIKDFSFRITSLTPINPNNKATKFEKRALTNFEQSTNREYYEFNKSRFQYMGALVTIESCLPCHKHQGYKVGDIRGGISVTLSRSEYDDIVKSLTDRVRVAKISFFIFLSIITLLIHKQFNSNEKLLREVYSQTKEIKSTKTLLQKILDADQNFLLVSDGKEIVFANETVLKFAEFTSLSDFEDNNKHISDKFERVDDEDFLKASHNGMHWINYIQQEQDNRELKVLVKKNGESKYFRPHSKEIIIDDQKMYLITFNDITDEYIKIQDLTTEASTDSLTQLFNRRRLDSVLTREMELSCFTKSPLSIIFLDIDHFKLVNDTFGHDAGDKILVDLSKIITSTTRKGDFIARWGGEEFMVALQSTDANEAFELAEKLRVAVEKYNFSIDTNITISIGVTENRLYESKGNFTKRADEALYEAKASGRNRVIVK